MSGKGGLSMLVFSLVFWAILSLSASGYATQGIGTLMMEEVWPAEKDCFAGVGEDTQQMHQAAQFDSTIFDRDGSLKAALGVFGPLEAKMSVLDFRPPYLPN